ncbi:hypothetical protein [Spirosoma endbachense]|uniref:Uncharacterized protein n=1 Tax=Spirosoma endbachense TaxID=2666025 RepID=A0A6P1VXE0_9BACT|nr:hypothetical protein [Spirosoma endbachense]QHV97304.1 hypothetical protein GJR95_20850 [Spirosoma endbachense]
MTTDQNYVGGGLYANPNPSVAENGLQTPSAADNRQPTLTPSITAEEFISQHAYLIGLAPNQLAQQLTERLQAQPVHYQTILDGIALLRAFTPTAQVYPNANYALLFRGWDMIGLAFLPNRPGDPAHAIATYENDNRNMMRHILQLDADKVLLATRLCEEEAIDDSWFREVKALRMTAMWYGYEHLDWLMLLPQENVSYVLEEMGEELLDGGVSYEALTEHYVDFPGIVFPSATY